MAFNAELPCGAQIDYKRITKNEEPMVQAVFDCRSCKIKQSWEGSKTSVISTTASVRLKFCKNLDNPKD